jgi:hypothetical protein
VINPIRPIRCLVRRGAHRNLPGAQPAGNPVILSRNASGDMSHTPPSRAAGSSPAAIQSRIVAGRTPSASATSWTRSPRRLSKGKTGFMTRALCAQNENNASQHAQTLLKTKLSRALSAKSDQMDAFRAFRRRLRAESVRPRRSGRPRAVPLRSRPARFAAAASC